MGWQIWKKKESSIALSGENSLKLEKPKELPENVGRHLVVEQNLDPDWVWSLKCVRKAKENSKSAFDIRVFSQESADQKGVKVRDYTTLEDHMDLVIFAGWYDKGSRKVQLEQLIKKAV